MFKEKYNNMNKHIVPEEELVNKVINSIEDNKKEQTKIKITCDICNTQFTKHSSERHLTSKPHILNLKKQGKEPEIYKAWEKVTCECGRVYLSVI